MRPTQQSMYGTYQPPGMMPSASPAPAAASFVQWANSSLQFNTANSSPGPSNGVGMQQVNPVPSLNPTNESGSSLPLLSSMDLEFLDPHGPSASQPRQDQQDQNVQHAQQTPHRKDAMPTGESMWYNYDLHGATGTQNGASSTGGMMGMGYQYTESQDGSEILQSLMSSQTGLHLKQEPQSQSNLTLLGAANSATTDCAQSFTMLNYSSTNGSAQEAMRQAATGGTNGPGQRNTQTPSYSMSSIVNDLNWPYYPE